MNVLVVHNRYREPGGEDRVVELETALLERFGHKVVRFIVDNGRIDAMGPVAAAPRTFWNHAAYREVRRLVAAERIDLLHVHNTLPLASPAVYYAASAERIPVVQTLHNYRLFCPSAQCVRDGRPCTKCMGRPFAWPSIRHACYRGSRAASGTVAAMLMVHRLAGTWHRKVDVYIAPTNFARGLFLDAGLPAERIVVKPHFVDPDPGRGSGRGGYGLYVGRLSEEKGVHILLAAWSRLGGRIPLVIVGDGPLAPLVEASRVPGLTWRGRQDRGEVQRLTGDAAFLVFPSVTYETFGQVIAEAYAAGTPVIAADGGAAAELVDHQRTGLLARRGDPDDLAAQVERLLSRPDLLAPMRDAARAEYEARFTASAAYRSLLDIYTHAIARSGGERHSGADPTASAGRHSEAA